MQWFMFWGGGGVGGGAGKCRKWRTVQTVLRGIFQVVAGGIFCSCFKSTVLIIIIIASLCNRRAKRLCVANVTGFIQIRLLWCLITSKVTVLRSFTKRSFKWTVKFGGNCFQTELLSCLSHKVCHLLPSASLCLSSPMSCLILSKCSSLF